MRPYDSVIIGAGIIGLTIATELKNRHPEQKILILEKEDYIGKHSSGRNSGILHSGIYYPTNTLKARVCSEGAKEMAEFCENNKLPINRTGKVIVPVNEPDDTQLSVLYKRGGANGASIEIIDEKQLLELEPEARSCSGRALFSPNTAVIDPKKILERLMKDLLNKGVDIKYKQFVECVDIDRSAVKANGEDISYGHIFNTSGLYADKVAKSFGAGKQYTILPFKGIYYEMDPAAGIHINHLIYPVPDLRVPFLGVHFTKAINGKVYLGPNAVPAFGRENYNKLQGADVSETLSITLRLMKQYISNNQGFRYFAHTEGMRYFKRNFAKTAQAMVPRLKTDNLKISSKVGIRAQLLDTKKGELVMDFLVENAKRSTHILNAVSPAFTSSFSLSRHILDNYYDT